MAEAAAIQNLNPEQKRLFYKKLEEGLAKMVKQLEEEIEKEQESEYIEFEGHKIRKRLNQRIPATAEQLAKEKEKRKQYERERGINRYIHKVFFEDGALEVEVPEEKRGIINLKEMEKQQQEKSRDLNSFIDKVFFEDGALQLENHA